MSDTSTLRIVDHLLRYQVPLVVIGGHAVNVHGFARATEDVDIVFRRSPESEIQLATALEAIHAYWIGQEIDPATGIERTYAVTIEYLRRRASDDVGDGSWFFGSV